MIASCLARLANAAVAVFLAAAMALPAFGAGTPSDQSPAATDPSGMTDAEIAETLRLAWRYGFPLVGTDAFQQGYAQTINRFYLMKTGANTSTRNIVAYNAETIYIAGILKLKEEPLIMTVPKTGDRLLIMCNTDGWNNAFSMVGTRTEGGNGGYFMFAGPSWKGEVPKGVKLLRSQTSMAVVAGRLIVKDREDAQKNGWPIVDQFSLTPLSRWQERKANPNVDALVTQVSLGESANYNNMVPKLSISEFFNKLNELMIDNPPYDYDKPLLERLAKLGIGPGLKFDYNRFSPQVRAVIDAYPRYAVTRGLAEMATSGLKPEMRRLTNRFGTDYDERFNQTVMGIGGQLQEDGTYIFLNTDARGARLDGNNRYLIRFEPGQLPPVRGFWSFTVYDKGFYLARDIAIDRHVLNNNSPFTYGKDGSVEFYLQPESPGPDKEANWLPTPRDTFQVIMRAYWPKQQLLDRLWVEPVVQKVQ